VDLDRKLITIPSTRTKAKREHIIPICPMLLALLESLPRFSRGPGYVFTMTGTKAITGFNKPKHRIDAASGVGLTDEDAWVAHDLRRTMRSNLSALPIEDRVREQMIGHAQPGLHAVYDRHAYSDEKVRGFQLWEARLAGILNPATVTDIGSARKRRAA
jgi:integrase